MKLSIWMLVKWFEADKPNVVILEGAQAIEGVRFYTDDDLFDNRFLYVCRTSDIYSSSTSNSVLVVFRNDTISFASNDLNEIFNRIIEAFEFYNEWERHLLSATASATPEQDIVDSCAGLLGPVFIMDGSMSIVASSSGYQPGEINDFWDIVVLGKGVPDMSRTAGSNFARMHFVDHDCTMFVDESAAPYSYGISASVHGASGSVMGQMVIASREPMGPYEMQLAHMMAAAIDSVKKRRAASESSSYAENILYDLLENRIDCTSGAHKLMLLQEWRANDTLCALRVEASDADNSELASLKRLLALELPESVTIIRNAGVEGLVRTLGAAPTHIAFEQRKLEGPFRIGLSNDFHDVAELSLRMRQADDALRYSPLDQHLCLFRAQGLAVMTHASDRDYALHAAHPAIKELKAWDSAHRTQLSDTLRCFLEHERSYAKTAQALFVHRNTVLYRVEKACEVVPLDLEDPYERLYLMVSFIVCDERDHENARS